MANEPGTVEGNVDLEVDGSGIVKAIAAIETKIAKIQGAITKIVNDSTLGAAEFDKKLSGTVAGLQQALGQVNTLQKKLEADARKPITQANQNAGLARATSQAATYAKTLDNATTSADALQAKLNDINKAIARGGADGILPKRAIENQKKNTERAIADLRRLDGELERLEAKARRSKGIDVSFDKAQVQQARKSLLEATLNPRRSNFQNEINALSDAQAGLAKAIGDFRNKGAETLRSYRQNAREGADEARKQAQVELAYRARELSDVRQVQAQKRLAADEDKAYRSSQLAARRELTEAEKIGAAQVAALNRKQFEDDARADKERELRRKDALKDHQTSLKTRKDAAVAEVAALRASGNAEALEQARIRNAGLIAAARDRLKTSTGEEARKIHEILDIEKARGQALRQDLAAEERRAAAIERQEKAQRNLVARLDQRFRKDGLRDEIAAEKAANNLTNARVEASRRLLDARQRYKLASAEEKQELLRTIELERARLRLIDQEVAAAKRLAEAESRGAGRDKGSPIKNILTPSYAGAAFARTAVYGAAAGVAYGAFNAVQEGLQFVVQFEDELKNLQAISGATETQLASLSDTIVDVASQSKFSTLEITKAATTLAQAGFSTSDMEKSLAAVTGLAAASGSSPAEAVDVLTSSISAFNLQTSEASRVSDVLVAALNRSKLTIEQVRLAIQYVGATAYEQNISLEQLVATAGALANAGVRSGSTIGTGLRQLLVDLQNPSEKLLEQFNRLNISLADVDVKTRGFPAVLQTLTDKGFGAAQAYGALETRAAAAYLVLRNQQDTLGDLLVAVARQGAAAEANAKAMDSLSAQWTRFTNILSTSASGALQDTVDFLKSVLTIAGDGIQKIKDLREEASKSGVAEQVQQYSLPGPLDALSALNKALLTVADSGVIAGRELGLLDQNTRGWGERWIAYSDSVSGSSANLDDLSTATKDATEQLDAQQQTVSSLDQEIARLLLQQNSIANNQRLVQAETITLTSRFEGLAVQLGTTENKFYDLVNALRAYRKEQREALGTALQGQINAVTLERDSLNRQGGQQIRAIRTSNEYGLLKPAERAALNNPTRDANAAILTDAANRLIKSNPTIARQLLGLSTTAGRFVELGVQQRGAQEALSFNRAATSNYGQQASNFFEGVQARIGQITPQATGKEPGERKALFNAPIADLDRFDRELERKLNAGGLREGDREFIEDLRQQVASAKAGVQALVDPTSAEQKASDRAANKAAGAARRAQNKALSNDQFLERSQLKTAELDIKDALEDVAQASALAIYDEGREAAMAALDRWVDERNQLADAEIAKRGLGGEQAELYRREVAEEIRAKTDQVVRALNDGFRKYIDAQVDQINREFDQALQPTQRALGIAEGLRSGLDRESLNGKVPDYVRQLADRRAGLARDEADRAAIPANEARIARLQQLANDTRARIEVAKGEGASTAEVATLNIEVEKLTQQIDELSVANDNLKASFHSETLIPPTLGASLRSAIDAYAQANGVNNTFAENLKNNLGGAVAAVGEGFRGFFSSIISGSQSAGGAFMGFVKSVIRALEELLAQQLALMLLKQIFSMFGSSFGGSTSTSLSAGTAGGGSIGGASGASFMPTTLRYRGGPITGYDTGGLVRNGVPNRDSVNAKLAKGEFVLRKSAVDSLGAEFVSDLNRRGKMAIEGLKKMPTVVQQMPKQEMAVYVVAPEQRPSLTPNDVLVTIQEDILKDGTTKKLIKHVSQGG